MTLAERLRGVFVQSLGISAEAVTDTLEYNSIREWDSIAHMALIAAIDQEFGIMLETEDVIDMSSFAQAQAIVAKYGITDAA